jgi:F0F1-type ATP synthase assembly protein I
MKNSSLNEKRKEVNKWVLIWAGLVSVSLMGVFLFIILTEKKPDPVSGLPWWILAPVIVGIILAIPLLKKTWEYEKLTTALFAQKGEK